MSEDKILKLSAEEIEIIEGWYNASAGESAHDRDEALFALLDKLGIEAHQMDLYLPDPDDFIEEHRHVVNAHRTAISAYGKRHPEAKIEGI